MLQAMGSRGAAHKTDREFASFNLLNPDPQHGALRKEASTIANSSLRSFTASK